MAMFLIKQSTYYKALILLSQPMELKQPEEEEWEGFERFQDSSLHQPLSLPPIPISTAPNTTATQTIPTQAYPPTRLPIAQSSQSKHKKKLHDSSIVEEPKRHTAASVRQTQKYADEGVKKTPKAKRYKRIPIARIDQDQYRSGKRVYAAFHSRNSDTWLRDLKEVDWETEGQPRAKGSCPLRSSNKGLLQFESKFQGGNLSLAVEGGSLRV